MSATDGEPNSKPTGSGPPESGAADSQNIGAEVAVVSGVSATDSTGPTPEALQAFLDEARQQAEQNWDLVLRSRAELENLRRRHERDLETTRKFALDGFVRELLGVWDSLELGLSAAEDSHADLGKLREGIGLTVKLFEGVMGKFGVQSVNPQGQPFNPDLHQAMSMLPKADLPANTVIAVVQKGYTLNGRLMRPAMVLVSQQLSSPAGNSLE